MGTVIATRGAIDAIMRLRAAHHTVAFRPSGGGRGYKPPNSVVEAKLPADINDLQLGEIGGVPFLIDADLNKRWGYPDLVVDVSHRSDRRLLADGAEKGVRLTLRPSH